MKIIPGVLTIVGQSEAEARAKYEVLQKLVDPRVGLALLSASIGADLSAYLAGWTGSGSAGDERLQEPPETARRPGAARKSPFASLPCALPARAAIGPSGTPTWIADELEAWFLDEGARGFNVMPALLQDGLTDFVDPVIPELQRRGLCRTEYEGRTRRENLGLRRYAPVR